MEEKLETTIAGYDIRTSIEASIPSFLNGQVWALGLGVWGLRM